MPEFQTIAGIASVLSLIISLIALGGVRYVWKKTIILSSHIETGSVKNPSIKDSPNTVLTTGPTNITVIKNGDVQIANAETSINEIKHMIDEPNSAGSEKIQKTIYILTKRLEDYKKEYIDYKEIHRLSPDTSKIKTLSAEISSIEFEIDSLRRDLGTPNT